MKKINEYKKEFTKLVKELEKEYGEPIKCIYITHIDDDDTFRCDIEF